MVSSSTFFASLVLALSFLGTDAFDMSANNNVAAYWGQNAFGAVGGSKDSWQQPIDYYCQDDAVDTFPIAFMTSFIGTAGMPEINLANTCDGPPFEGTALLNCQELASSIKKCQDKGKIVTISLGGAAAGVTTFASDDEAEAFADTMWHVFLGGVNDTRPFGDAVLDGIDLDIEGGDTSHYDAFVKKLRTYFDGAPKKYYVTAAPQCPFPDAWMGSVIDSVPFDAVYVQFYNNYCQVTSYDDPNSWNFATWDTWAKNTSPNKDVKVYIGVPGADQSAGSGYLSVDQLAPIIQATQTNFSSFGGVMMWDVSSAYNNDRFEAAVKKVLSGGSPAPSGTASSVSVPSSSPTSSFRPSASFPSATVPPQSSTSLASTNTDSFTTDPSSTDTSDPDSSATACPDPDATDSCSPDDSSTDTSPAASTPFPTPTATGVFPPPSSSTPFSVNPSPVQASSVPSSTPSATAQQLHPSNNRKKCLDVQGGTLANGTPVQIYDCNGSASQDWTISPGSTTVQLAGSNFCLDAGPKVQQGGSMKIWSCVQDLLAQSWFYTADGHVGLQIKGLCLDLTNSSTSNGNVVQTVSCTDTSDQIWTTS